ncbi:polymeric immunoglobulin receptor-like [Hoplias malabaricus]|uniref:polymeric immunoglobulin receptor-like n=1 Tax=Hoplias malabaricus TaxID=27720 RepID=UPI00346264AA
MKNLLIFTLYLISGAVDCSDVIGFTGGSVIITCKHKRYSWRPKVFCKMKTQSECDSTKSAHSYQQNIWVQNGRISVSDNSQQFTVLIKQLGSEDSGMYQCGESGRWSHDVNLTVITYPCCSGPERMTGFLRDTVTISCSYPEEFTTTSKAFYRQTNGNIDLITDTTESQKGRFSVSDDTSSKVVSVRISDVREEDGGVYYCGALGGGESVSYESLFTEIQLQVTGSSTAIIIIIIILTVSVCVTLLLIGGLVLIYKLRHSLVTLDNQTATLNTTTNDYENDLPRNINISPEYYTPKAKSHQSDSVYQNLAQSAHQSDSAYQSLQEV